MATGRSRRRTARGPWRGQALCGPASTGSLPLWEHRGCGGGSRRSQSSVHGRGDARCRVPQPLASRRGQFPALFWLSFPFPCRRGTATGFVKWGRQLPVPSSAGRSLQAGRARSLAWIYPVLVRWPEHLVVGKGLACGVSGVGFCLNSLPHPGGGGGGRALVPQWGQGSAGQHSRAGPSSCCMQVRQG